MLPAGPVPAQPPAPEARSPSIPPPPTFAPGDPHSAGHQSAAVLPAHPCAANRQPPGWQSALPDRQDSTRFDDAAWLKECLITVRVSQGWTDRPAPGLPSPSSRPSHLGRARRITKGRGRVALGAWSERRWVTALAELQRLFFPLFSFVA